MFRPLCLTSRYLTLRISRIESSLFLSYFYTIDAMINIAKCRLPKYSRIATLSSMLSPHSYLKATVATRCYSSLNNEIDLERQKRKTNIGTMIQYLETKVPNLLHETIDRELLDEKIKLRILPNSFHFFPTIQGPVKYISLWETVTSFLTRFIIEKKNTKLVITNICVNEKNPDGDKSSDSSSDSKNDSIDAYGLYGSTSKIVIRFKSDNKDKFITGIFVFELNRDNDRILVHTIDNVEIVNDKKVDMLLAMD